MQGSVVGGSNLSGSANTPTSPSPSPSSPLMNKPSSTTATTTTSPTIYVYYGSRHVKARIDQEVPLEEIIRQLTASSQLQISEPSSLFALRVKSTGQLVTCQNLHETLLLDNGNGKNVFTLGSSPQIEAIETIEKLSSNLQDDPLTSSSQLKLTTFSLKTLIKDRDFLKEFLSEKRDGWKVLEEVVENSNGNTLAYALNVVRDLEKMRFLENNQALHQGGEGERLIKYKASKRFVERLVQIVSTQPLINISKPATSILLYLLSLLQQQDTTTTSCHFNSIRRHLIPSTTSSSSSLGSKKGGVAVGGFSQFLPNLISHLPRETPVTGTSNFTPLGNSTTRNVAIEDSTESSELSLSLITLLLKGFIEYDDRLDSVGGSVDRAEKEEERLMSLQEFRNELEILGFYEIITSILNYSSSFVGSSSTTAATTTTTTTESIDPTKSNLVQLAQDFLFAFHRSLQQTYSRSLSLSDSISTEGGDDSVEEKEDKEREFLEKFVRVSSPALTKEIRDWWEINSFSSVDGGGGKGRGGREALRVFKEWVNERGRSQQRFEEEEFENIFHQENRLIFVSFEITKLLINHFNLLSSSSSPPSSSSSSHIDPLIFHLKGLHNILIQFWLKLYKEQQQQQGSDGGQTVEEVAPGSKVWNKVTGLVKTLFESIASNSGSGKSLKEIETIFETSDSTSTRALQLKELEKISSKSLESKPLENLKTKLESDSFELVKRQRIECLKKGIWVVHHLDNSSSSDRPSFEKWWLLRLVSNLDNNNRRNVENLMNCLEWIQVENVDEKELLENEINSSGAGGGGGVVVLDQIRSRYQTGQIELSSITKITTSVSSSSLTSPSPAPPSSLAIDDKEIKVSTIPLIRKSPPPPPPPPHPTKLHRRNPSNSRLSSFLIRSNHNNSNSNSSSTTLKEPSASSSHSTTLPSQAYSIILHLSSSSSESSPSLTLHPQTLESYSELLDSLHFLLPLLSNNNNNNDKVESFPELSDYSSRMIKDLTLIGMKIKLLDLDGEGIEPIDFSTSLNEQEEEGEAEEEAVGGKKEKKKIVKSGGLVRSVPGEEERFYYREFI
ncbi:hypothetical protein JCM5350_005522 [Sporobolomyces pararoseus]